MRRRIVEMAARPEAWLGLLGVWVCLSAFRSWHTAWMQVAGTEALRWSVGIGLALALGAGLRSTGRMAQALTLALGTIAAAAVFTGRRPDGLVTGPYGDHQLCASALLALLPFSVALAVAAPRTAWRWLGQVITPAALVCLALTQTRSAWAGAVAGGCVFAWLWLGRLPVSGRPLPRLLVPGLLAAGVALAFLMLVHGTDMGDPLAARAATLGALGRDADWQWRLHTWRGTLRMISVHPLIGWGLGHYPAAHWPFMHSETAISPARRPNLSDQAHDLYLQTAAEMGLIGLCLYGASLIAFVRLALKTLADRTSVGRRSGRRAMRDALLVATLSLLAAQGVDALASPSWQFSEVSLLGWLGLGLGLAATRSVHWEEEAPVPLRVRRALQYCAAGAAAVLLTAQALPVGLLFPASAGPLSPQPSYAPTLTGLSVTEATGVTSVSKPYPSLPYNATATYSDGSTANINSKTVFAATGNSFFSGMPGGSMLTVKKSVLSNVVTITARCEGLSATTTLTLL